MCHLSTAKGKLQRLGDLGLLKIIIENLMLNP